MMENIRLNKIIVSSAESGLKFQREDGSFPPGHNGPWNNQETPVRATSHWAILMLKAYELTKNKKFKDAAQKSGDYLIDKKNRPFNFSFFCRNGKNKCNGLIGQAWAIEALIELGDKLKERKYFEIAEDVVLKHHFNKKKNLWHNLEIDGRKLNINKTLNQQIWFAVMAYKLGNLINNEAIKSKANSFFINLHKHLHFNGKYITHLIHPLSGLVYRKEAKGYLSFTLAGLANIYTLDPSFLDKKMLSYILRSIKFLNKRIYTSNLKFCWSYNPTGFEMGYVLYTLKLGSAIVISNWVSEQLKRHFNFKEALMNRNTSDKVTLAARIYEATWLPNINLIF